MELFLFRHAEYERLYNCSLVNIDDIPLEKRLFPFQSQLTILLCTIYYVLYIPCVLSIYYRLRENSCYKFLFYIAIADLAILWILGFYVGYMSMTGKVFCSHPMLAYVIGALATSIWMCESTADLLLAINRCVHILSPKLYEFLYSGNRAWLWCSIPSVYFLYWFMFMNIAFYSSVYFGSWLIAWPNVDDGQMMGRGLARAAQNAFREEFVATTWAESNGDGRELAWISQQWKIMRPPPPFYYTPKLYALHNYMIAICLPGIYLASALVFFLKFKFNRIQQITRAEKMVFLQVLSISVLNATATVLYVHMQFVETDAQFLFTISHFSWFHIHDQDLYYISPKIWHRYAKLFSGNGQKFWSMSCGPSPKIFRDVFASTYIKAKGFPPVIYLLLNKTIRGDFIEILANFMERIKITRTHGVSAAIQSGWIT